MPQDFQGFLAAIRETQNDVERERLKRAYTNRYNADPDTPHNMEAFGSHYAPGSGGAYASGASPVAETDKKKSRLSELQGFDPEDLLYGASGGLPEAPNTAKFGDQNLDTFGLNVFNPSNPGRAFTGALNRSGINTVLPNAGQGFFRENEDLINRLFPVLSALMPEQYGSGRDPNALSAFLGGQGGDLSGATAGLLDPNVSQNALRQLLFGTEGEGGQVSMNPFSGPAGQMRFALESSPRLMAQTVGSLLSAGASPFWGDATQAFVANLVNSLFSDPSALQGTGGRLLQALAQFASQSR